MVIKTNLKGYVINAIKDKNKRTLIYLKNKVTKDIVHSRFLGICWSFFPYLDKVS